MSEPVGKKLRTQRLNRKITLDDAARATKIRAERIEDLERDDYSNFPTLVYAKGFLTIYANYLDVDIDDFLESFTNQTHVGTEGYEYLSSEPEDRDVASRSSSSSLRGGSGIGAGIAMIFTWLLVAAVIAGGVWFLVSSFKRINAESPDPVAEESAPEAVSPTPAVTDESLVAATPMDSSAVPVAIPEPAAPTAAATAPDSTTESTDPPEAAAAVAVAVPVVDPVEDNAEDFSIEIRAEESTEIRVFRNRDYSQPAYEGNVTPGDETLKFQGAHFSVYVRDIGAIQALKEGEAVDYTKNTFVIE